MRVIRNLSRAATMIARFDADDILAHEDVNVFHAPSECHDLVRRRMAKQHRHLRRQIKSLTGVRYWVVLREIKRRIGATGWLRASNRVVSDHVGLAYGLGAD